MALILLALILAILFRGLGFALHALWWIAAIAPRLGSGKASGPPAGIPGRRAILAVGGRHQRVQLGLRPRYRFRFRPLR
jgi:hypothetical protein